MTFSGKLLMKKSELSGRTINIRLVEENDAEFITSLRGDPRYNTHLSKVDDDVEKQREWIKEYKIEETLGNQYYFIIQDKNNIKCGTVRLYDFRNDSFCWGSWILNENKTRFSALESAFLVYEYAFNILGFKQSHFDVRKENTKVIAFHKKMGAILKGEDNLNYYYEIYPDTVWALKSKLSGKV
jgi:RimJ/RimL family protein N-acetyltransferase